MDINSIPANIINDILSWTDPATMAFYKQTCKKNNQIDYEQTWRSFVQDKIKLWNCSLSDKKIKNYKRFYRNLCEAVDHLSMYYPKCDDENLIRNLQITFFPESYAGWVNVIYNSGDLIVAEKEGFQKWFNEQYQKARQRKHITRKSSNDKTLINTICWMIIEKSEWNEINIFLKERYVEENKLFGRHFLLLRKYLIHEYKPVNLS